MSRRRLMRARQALALLLVAIPWLILAWDAVSWVHFAVDLPVGDDWLALADGTADSFDPAYLFGLGNSTLYPLGRVLDSAAMRLLGGDSIVYQLLSLVVILGLVLVLQWVLLRRALRDVLLAAIAFSVTVLSLRAETFWGLENLAYHQAAPIVAILAALVLISTDRVGRRTVAAGSFVAGIVAGAFYISGAPAALAAGFVLTVVAGSIRGTLGGRARWGGIALLVAGSVTGAIQVWSTMIAVGVEESIGLAMPWDGDFWRYLLGIVSDSLLLPSDRPQLSFLLGLAVAVAVVGIGLVLFVRLLRQQVAGRHTRLAVTIVVLSATIGSYLLILVAGRLDLVRTLMPREQDAFVRGFARFYDWWVTLLWPWLAALGLAAARWQLRRTGSNTSAAVTLAGVAVAITVLSMAGSSGALDYGQWYGSRGALRDADARCVEQALAEGRPALCEDDRTSAVVNAAGMGATFVRRLHLPSITDSSGAQELFKLSAARADQVLPDRLTIRRAEDGAFDLQPTGYAMLLMKDIGAKAMLDCRALGIQAEVMADRPTFSVAEVSSADRPAFEQRLRRFAHVPSTAGRWTTLSYLFISPAGFIDRVRFSPSDRATTMRMRDLDIYCLWPAAMVAEGRAAP